MIRERLRGRLEGWLLRVWFGEASLYGRLLAALAAPVALPLSWLVAVVARRRRRAIVRQDAAAAVPVVVVGNLVAGGAGKTPLVAAIARGLAAGGFSPGLLAGGYRAASAGRTKSADGAGAGITMVDAASDAAVVGDEALLLALETGLPVAVGKDRGAAAAALCRRHPGCDVLVSDDGLQHVGLPRRIELLVIDDRGFGNGRCLPAGPLREPGDRIDSVDAIVLTTPTAAAPRPHPRQYRSALQMTVLRTLDGNRRWQPGEFAGHHGGGPLHAIAGIAKPARFFESLQALGLRPECHALPDHAAIDARWLGALPARWILMTAKDAVKCRGFDAALLARCVRVDVEARPDPALLKWLAARLHPAAHSNG